MKKITLLAVIIGFLVACNCQVSKQRPQKEELVLQQGDSLFYENDDFRVIGQEKEGYPGHMFRIYNKKTEQAFKYTGSETDALWYLAVYDKFLMLDSGTGTQHRDFIVVDMKKGKEVRRLNYVSQDGVVANGNIFIYWASIDKLPEGVEPPDCPEVEGIPQEQHKYVEKKVFNISALNSKSLKEYKCVYFE